MNKDKNTHPAVSRREALKYIGTGVVGTAGTLYGLNRSSLFAQNPATGPEETPIAARSGNSMKVLLINGSPRANGNTFTALSEIAATLENEGVKTHLVQIGRQPVPGCIECGGCAKTRECILDDPLYKEVKQQLEEVDGIIIGSPVFFSGPNGSLCALLDRVFYTSSHLLHYKVGATLAICRRSGGTATVDRLNKYITYSRMLLIGSQYWNIGHGAGAGEVTEDKEGMQIMRTLAKNVAWTIKNIKAGKQPLPKAEKHISTNFIRQQS